jgi:hypothetical protein
MNESRKLPGSLMFGTDVIRTDEAVLLAKVMKDENHTPEETMLIIHAFDDMLAMQRMRSIIRSHRFTATGRIRKDSAFSDFISGRIDELVKDLKEVNEGRIFKTIDIEP